MVWPLKPKQGETCNGCGHCCKVEACKLSIEFLKSEVAPCIALEHEGGRYWCGFLRNPGKYLNLDEHQTRVECSPRIAFMLGIGSGCDDSTPPAIANNRVFS